jgi:HK97 family phage major capsid protein
MDQKEFDALVAKGVAAALPGEIDKALPGAVEKVLPGAVEKAMKDETVRKSFLGGGSPLIKLSSEPVTGEIVAARYIKALAVSGLSRETMSPQSPLDIAKAMYPRDAALAEALEQRGSPTNKALSATILTEGGSTVPEVLSSELILPLYTKIGVTKLGGRRVPLVNGNMTIPRIDTAASVGWVGENKRVGKSQEVTGDIKLNAKKLGVIVPISNDLLRSATMAADQWVLDDIRNQMFVEMDRSMLYGSNTQYQPGGLNTLLPTAQKQGSSSTAFTTTLISQLYGALQQANVAMLQPGIIMNAVTEAYLMNLTTSTGAFLFYAEMVERGTVRGIPYAVSNNCNFTDTGTYATSSVDFFIGDWSEFVIGEQLPLSVEMSREASYYDGSATISAYQNDQTLIRVLSLMDYNIRHTASFIKYTAKLATS